MNVKERTHTSWNPKYHIVFILERRKKVLFGQWRSQWGEMLHELVRHQECQIVAGHWMLNHMHMCMSIPLNPAVSGSEIYEAAARLE